MATSKSKITVRCGSAKPASIPRKAFIQPRSLVHSKASTPPKRSSQPKGRVQPEASVQPKARVQPKAPVQPEASIQAEASVKSKDPVRRRRMNIHMVQNVLLIWLDNNIDEENADCRNTLTQFRRIVNSINTFTDSEECIQFLEMVVEEKVCMIISGSLGQRVVPQIHNMSQVDSIFIYRDKDKYSERWAKGWSKIKGVFAEIGPICKVVKKTAQQCEHNAMTVSFMDTGGDLSGKNLDQLGTTFMYTQILKEILLTIKFEQQHIDEFIEYCREALADNEDELKNLKRFERQYRDQTPIWWYTYQCFLYPMLNRSLRLMDVDMIVRMGFFIGDLHRHIDQLHREQFPGHTLRNSFTVYRGQGLSKVDFEQFSKT